MNCHTLNRPAVFFLSTAVLLTIGSWSLAAQEGKPPNIVLFLADDMGWTDAQCFGSDLYETPNIDRLAAEGMKFTNSYAACHVCSPTRASILTGKYPARLHLTNFIPGREHDGGMHSPAWTKHLLLEETTIAEALHSAGYVCGHFGKWHLNRDKEYRPGRPMDPGSQGFDAVLTTVKPKATANPRSDPHHVRQITDAALTFIEQHRERPFFCYVTHNSLHRPTIGRPDLVDAYQERIGPNHVQTSAKYAAMVHDLDKSVARIVAKLEALQLVDNTLLIFTSDNGGFTGDRKDAGTENYPLRAGKGSNYEGGVRIPTIIRWPGIVQPGSVCHEPIISNDFFPAIAQVSGLAENTSSTTDGLSIVPLLRDSQAHLKRHALYWHYPHYHAQGATPHGAIRAGAWKLIEFFEDMHVELYNLVDDIGEENDLAAKMPEKAAALREQLHTWRDEVGAQMPLPAR